MHQRYCFDRMKPKLAHRNNGSHPADPRPGIQDKSSAKESHLSQGDRTYTLQAQSLTPIQRILGLMHRLRTLAEDKYNVLEDAPYSLHVVPQRHIGRLWKVSRRRRVCKALWQGDTKAKAPPMLWRIHNWGSAMRFAHSLCRRLSVSRRSSFIARLSSKLVLSRPTSYICPTYTLKRAASTKSFGCRTGTGTSFGMMMTSPGTCGRSAAPPGAPHYFSGPWQGCDSLLATVNTIRLCHALVQALQNVAKTSSEGATPVGHIV